MEMQKILEALIESFMFLLILALANAIYTTDNGNGILQFNNFFFPNDINLQSDFDSELDAHKHGLDERFKLCHSCQDTVKHHLNTQAMDLKTFLLGSHLQQSRSTPTKVLSVSLCY